MFFEEENIVFIYIVILYFVIGKYRFVYIKFDVYLIVSLIF